MRHENKSMFLRPRVESASVASASPPARQPMKKAEAGRPVMKEGAHSRPHSAIIDVWEGQSQDHEFLGSSQMLDKALQTDSSPPWVQCQDGSASVNTLMKVC
ncbi:hypothetical protein ES332_D13G158300v1 [Gossypium tomentosum]|uniref:Uncharacterized protein n=1 Tax=Gossypium tomentosum TaxID=34277 RepID=A0A5D2HXK3_GOSTO|nr:hypothetical protein ES332_D13G158300v1 [Gossypium tomentosum]